MMLPHESEARKYHRAATERLKDAELILEELNRPTAAVYLAGYAIECMLKSLLLTATPAAERTEMLKALKDNYGHSFRRLRSGLARKGVELPRNVLRELIWVSSWSPDMRYELQSWDRDEARKFIKSARIIVVWADGRI